MTLDRNLLVGKRIAALDVGMARIGVAVCDERHIVVSTRPVVNQDADVWTNLNRRFTEDRIDLVLVGIPELHDERETEIIRQIRTFIDELKSRVALPVYEVDEAFSTQKALHMMKAVGTSKKRRSTKGTKDQMAAAIILQDVLNEL